MAAVVEARLFVSWCHADAKLKIPLMDDLRRHLKILSGVQIHCWQDQDLYVGDVLVTEVARNIDDCDYGLLLLSPAYFASDFITAHELPRFAGPFGDRPMIPVDLSKVPVDGSRNLHGIEDRLVFRHRGRSFEQCAGPGRAAFVLELATQIRRRVRHDRGLAA
jgi:hypothetical protein